MSFYSFFCDWIKLMLCCGTQLILWLAIFIFSSIERKMKIVCINVMNLGERVDFFFTACQGVILHFLILCYTFLHRHEKFFLLKIDNFDWFNSSVQFCVESTCKLVTSKVATSMLSAIELMDHIILFQPLQLHILLTYQRSQSLWFLPVIPIHPICQWDILFLKKW